MTIKTLYRAVVFGVLTLLMSGRVLASPTITGYWLKETEDPLKSAIIEIYPDDGGFDGRVLKLKHPAFVEGETSVTGDVVPEALVGQIKTDVLNPVEVLRKRPIEGMKIIDDFKRDGDRQWKGATIYNPEDGKTYACKAELSRDGQTLEVRGFIGFALLGRSQTWTRLPSPDAVDWGRPQVAVTDTPAE